MKRAINRWSKLSPTFLQVLGVIFLAGYAWPIINPNLSPALHSLCNWTLFVIWIFFAFDYFARLSIAENKRVFVRKNLLDLAAVALPFLPLLRAIRALAAVTVLSRRNRGSRSQQVTTSVVTLAFATWFVAGLAVTEAERQIGYFRDGFTTTDESDFGSHTVCAVVSAEFLEHQKSVGNDLSTPAPQFGFAGLKPGDRWAVCAPRWQQALEDGAACGVVLAATNEAALEYINAEDLIAHSVDVPPDLSELTES